MRLRFDAIAYRLPMRRSLVTSSGTIRERRGFWVVLRDEEGNTGLGEIAPLPGWATESIEDAQRWIERLTGGEPLTADLRRWDEMLADSPATHAGIELALLDLEARRAGVRLAEMIAPDARASVPCNALLTEVDAEALADEASAAVSEGYGTLKVKVGGRPLLDDVRRIEAVRERVGPTIGLRADANGAWDLETAVHALGELASFDLEYVEQPVAHGFAELRRLSPVRIAADESIVSPASARALIAERAVDVVILKPMAIGGLRAAGAIAREAAAAGIEVVITSVLDTAVGIAGALHLAAGIPAASLSTGSDRSGSLPAVPRRTAPAHGLATADLLVGAPTTGLGRPERGMLALPSGAGLGVLLKDAAP